MNATNPMTESRSRYLKKFLLLWLSYMLIIIATRAEMDRFTGITRLVMIPA